MAHGRYWHTMNKDQQHACFNLFIRAALKCDNPTVISYKTFRKKFRLFDFYGGRDEGSYFGGEWRGIFYGIESDGYTHT